MPTEFFGEMNLTDEPEHSKVLNAVLGPERFAPSSESQQLSRKPVVRLGASSDKFDRQASASDIEILRELLYCDGSAFAATAQFPSFLQPFASWPTAALLSCDRN